MKTLLLPSPRAQAARRALPTLFSIAALTLAACASGPPPPIAQMTVSASAIDQAVSSGATELAPSDLDAAREKLDRARVAMNAHDNRQALILAEQSQADAQLAMARARSAKTEKAAASLQEDRRILREEIRRNER